MRGPSNWKGNFVRIITARRELQKKFCLWRRQSVVLLFVHEISRPSGTAEEICAKFTRKMCDARTSSKVKVKGQGHQGQKTAFFGPFGGLRAVYVW